MSGRTKPFQALPLLLPLPKIYEPRLTVLVVNIPFCGEVQKGEPAELMEAASFATSQKGSVGTRLYGVKVKGRFAES